METAEPAISAEKADMRSKRSGIRFGIGFNAFRATDRANIVKSAISGLNRLKVEQNFDTISKTAAASCAVRKNQNPVLMGIAVQAQARLYEEI